MKITIANHVDQLPIKPALIRKTLRAAARNQGWSGNITVAIITDLEITDINRRFLGKDRPADVLAFLYGDDPDGEAGEIIVSADTARRVASTVNESAGRELLRYCVHGFLHLCGFDDQTPADRKVMTERQEELLPSEEAISFESND